MYDIRWPNWGSRGRDIVADHRCTSLACLLGECVSGQRRMYQRWKIIADEGEIIVPNNAGADTRKWCMVEDLEKRMRTRAR